MADTGGIREEQIRRGEIGDGGDETISSAMEFLGENFIRRFRFVVLHQHRRMIFAEFAEQNIERDGFRALCGKFVNEPSIDLSRPIQTEVIAEFAAFDGLNGFLVNAGEAEVGGDLRGEMQCGARAPVVGHPLETLEEIQLADGGDGDEQDDDSRDEGGSLFERLEFHLGELNKKTRATQGRSGFLKTYPT